MSNRAAIVAVALGLCGPAGCGGSASRDTPETGGADFSSDLPADAALAGVVRPTDLGTFLRELGEVSPGVDFLARNSVATLLTDPQLAKAFGVRPDHAVWFAMTGGPALQVLQMGEDLERHVEATHNFALAEWLAAAEVPAAWVNVRIVGRDDGSSPDPASWLGETYGALQAVDTSIDPVESLTTLLEVEEEAAQRIGGALGEAQLIRLLARDMPALIVVRRRAGRVIIDWIEDQDLGQGSLVKGLLTVCGLDQPEQVPGSAVSHLVGRLATTEVIRIKLNHLRYLVLARMIGEVAVMHVALTSQDLIIPRLEAVRMGRQAAMLPDRLMSPGVDLFADSTVVIAQEGKAISFDVEARYTSRGKPLAALHGGAAPVPHAMVAKSGEIVVTLAARPNHWGPILDTVAPKARAPLDQFLAEVFSCGSICGPALWLALPSYARTTHHSMAEVFPELGGFKSGLAEVEGATVVYRTEPTQRFAAALVLPQEAGPRGGLQGGDYRSAWSSLPSPLVSEWEAAGDRTILRVGSDARELRALAAVSTGQVQIEEPALQASAWLSGEQSSAFERLDGSVRFSDDALAVHLELKMRARSLSGKDGQ